MAKTWFITGAARGIGAEIVKAALAAGDQVVATGRNAASIEKTFGAHKDRILAQSLDVTSEAQALAAVEAALKRFGRIDVLVNNAGYGLLGAFEENVAKDIEQQYQTNVFGVLHVTRAVLPVMRKQRSGHIFNLSSIGGVVGYPCGAIYCSTKFAIEGFSESLRWRWRSSASTSPSSSPVSSAPISSMAAPSSTATIRSPTTRRSPRRCALATTAPATSSPAIRRSSQPQWSSSPQWRNRRRVTPPAGTRSTASAKS
jgi:NAD(P)-dependent dehydrogenase (short-subunit alcohol dehydrogenase family)